MDSSQPDSSVHGIFQARIMEWVAISFSRGSSRPRDQTQVSHIVGRHFTVWATREVQSRQTYGKYGQSRKSGLSWCSPHTHTGHSLCILCVYSCISWRLVGFYILNISSHFRHSCCLTSMLKMRKLKFKEVKSLSKVTSEPRVFDFQFIAFVVVISQSTRNSLVQFWRNAV